MQKKVFQCLILALFTVFSSGLLTACQQTRLADDIKSTSQTITPNEQDVHSEPELTQPEPTPDQPEPVQIAVPEPINRYLLIENTDGSLSVTLEDKEISDRHHPLMPSYIWSLNAKVEGINYIVVEFDLLDTVEPDDFYYFGYDRGFFIGLHNLDDVSDVLFYYTTNSNEWDITRIDEDPGKLSHLTAENKLYYPELAVDMSKYADNDGSGHYRVPIPYEQFKGGARELVLQFLPGATYANLHVYAEGNENIDPERIEELLSGQTPVEMVDFNDLTSDWWEANVGLEGWMRKDISDFVNTNYPWAGDVIMDGLINPDGTTNMYLKGYDLGEYADEIIGEYGVVPEGITAIQAALNSAYVRELRRNRTNMTQFVLDNMVDPETGLIYGVWDNEQGKLVATDRISKCTLQIATSMGGDNVDLGKIQSLIDAVIEHEILEIDGANYYVPGGQISDDGTIELELANFAVTDEFLRFFTSFGVEEDELKGSIATYKMLEGFANSLELLLKGQEQNPTNLPAETLRITFNADGTHTFESIGNFHMDNQFFSLFPITHGSNNHRITTHWGFRMAEKFKELIEHILAAEEGGNEEYAAHELALARNLAAGYMNSARIDNLYYQMYYNVYNYTREQDRDTIFAPGYDVNTGEPIFRDSVGEEDGSAPWDAYQQRFGATNNAVNYALLNLFFHDQELSRESIKMILTSFAIFQGFVLKDAPVDINDTDMLSIFFEKGYSIVGNDGIWMQRALSGPGWPSGEGTRALFDDAENFAWRDQSIDVFLERTLRQARTVGI